MKIYRSFNELPKIKNAVVTQGTFDGVHAGHKVIINRLKELASEIDGETVVMTFDPHPRLLLYPDEHNLKLLHTLNEKIEALDKAGIDHLLIIPFTKEFSKLTSEEFISDIIIKHLNTKILVIGYNHRFGNKREGSFENLKGFSKRFGFQVVEIAEQDVNFVSVSSTRIRVALSEGDIITANSYLGKNYSISGIVVKGNQLGRTIGFPTANIFINDKNKLIPANGVYAVNVIIAEKKYRGMLNSGYRPTVGGKVHTIEVHIFDFNSTIYNQHIIVEYVDKIRDEIKFNTIDGLRNQLEKDKLHAIQKLSATLFND